MGMGAVSLAAMLGETGILLPAKGPLLHFARKIDVLIWPLKKA